MLTKEKVAAAQNDIREALEAVAKKHGLTLGRTSVTYNNATFALKADFGDSEATGGFNPRYFDDLRKHGWEHGLGVEMQGCKFQWGGREVTFVGMKSGRWVIFADGADMFKAEATRAAAAVKAGAAQLTK